MGRRVTDRKRGARWLCIIRKIYPCCQNRCLGARWTGRTGGERRAAHHGRAEKQGDSAAADRQAEIHRLIEQLGDRVSRPGIGPRSSWPRLAKRRSTPDRVQRPRFEIASRALFSQDQVPAVRQIPTARAFSPTTGRPPPASGSARFNRCLLPQGAALRLPALPHREVAPVGKVRRPGSDQPWSVHAEAADEASDRRWL